MIVDQKTGILHRENTFDGWILNETKGYFPLGIKASDRILDLGGHIGCFAARAMLEKKVPLLSIEAELTNYEVLHENSKKFGFLPLHRAIVQDDLHKKEIKVYVNNLKNNALHSILPTRGRSEQVVEGYGFSKAIDNFDPTIVKCDIEGGEFFLPWRVITSNKHIRMVIMELHLTRVGFRDKARDMCLLFQDMGFRCTRTPNIGEKNWTGLGRWEKNVA